MKIESKYKDYYDSALGSFLESDVVFRRTQEHIRLRRDSVPNLGSDWNQRFYLPDCYKPKHELGYQYVEKTTLYLLGFCGKWYYGIIIDGHTTFLDLNSYAYSKINADELDNMRNRINKCLEIDAFKYENAWNDKLILKYLSFKEAYGCMVRPQMTSKIQR